MPETKVRDSEGGGKIERPLTIRQIADALEEMAERYGDHPCYFRGGPITVLNVIPTTDGDLSDQEKPNEFLVELRWRP